MLAPWFWPRPEPHTPAFTRKYGDRADAEASQDLPPADSDDTETDRDNLNLGASQHIQNDGIE